VYQKTLRKSGWRALPAADLAEQMCIYESKLFCAIKREDLIFHFSNEKQKAKDLRYLPRHRRLVSLHARDSSFLSAFIRHFDLISNFVSNSIDADGDIAESVKFYIDLADHLMAHRNYNGSVFSSSFYASKTHTH